jgi:hypothetical protein
LTLTPLSYSSEISKVFNSTGDERHKEHRHQHKRNMLSAEDWADCDRYNLGVNSSRRHGLGRPLGYKTPSHCEMEREE